MTIINTLKTIFIGSENLEQPKIDDIKWSDLTAEQKKTFVLFTTLTSVGFAFATAVAIDEIQNTPEGCHAVIFPEQTFLQQPPHCKRDYSEKPFFGIGS